MLDCKNNHGSDFKTIFITGGAGFIGSALIRNYIKNTKTKIINIDNLTYAGNLESLKKEAQSPQYVFERLDIVDKERVKFLLSEYEPDAIIHLAAETHVDRSIDNPSNFIQTNIIGTFNLLESIREYWRELEKDKKERFRFLHISTDEVFGSLGGEGFFSEQTPYDPQSPYSASKASSDHLVRAWHKTFGLPVLITNCSNNYGPYQFPEKLIPLSILNAMDGRNIPVYGTGGNIRDWLYVEDHVEALRLVLDKGIVGETYIIGGGGERTNIEVVKTICSILDRIRPASSSALYEKLIKFVEDRPGHDQRYAVDSSKIKKELGWEPKYTFETGMEETIQWYLNNLDWCKRVQKGSYNRERLGLGKLSQ